MTIFVVSGLRRSGTSMMMNILKEGGIPILDDNPDNADEFNPNGYFEWNTVMHNMLTPDLFRKCDGFVVKIIAITVLNSKEMSFLPDKDYKIIWMDRNVEEAVKSWKIKAGKSLEYTIGDIEYAEHKINTAIEWIKKQKNMKIIRIKYMNVLNNPEKEIKKIIKFIDVPFDIEKAIKVVDKNLYRVRL